MPASTATAGQKRASCIREAANWAAIKPHHRFDSAKFDADAVLADLPSVSPKLRAILDKIAELDAKDLREHGHTFKHFIFSDLKKLGYGAKVVAGALTAAGWNLAFGSNMRLKDEAQLLRTKGRNFGLLSSTAVFSSGVTGKLRTALLDAFNARPANVFGDIMRVMVLDSGFKEGIDLFDVKYVHLFEPQTTRTDERQAVGRGTRSCGQRGLRFDPKQGWPLHVYVYDVLDREGRSLHSQFLVESGLNLDLLSFAAELEDKTITAAVDAELTRPVHNFSIQEDEVHDFGLFDEDGNAQTPAEHSIAQLRAQSQRGGARAAAASAVGFHCRRARDGCGKRPNKDLPATLGQLMAAYMSLDRDHARRINARGGLDRPNLCALLDDREYCGRVRLLLQDEAGFRAKYGEKVAAAVEALNGRVKNVDKLKHVADNLVTSKMVPRRPKVTAAKRKARGKKAERSASASVSRSRSASPVSSSYSYDSRSSSLSGRSRHPDRPLAASDPTFAALKRPAAAARSLSGRRLAAAQPFRLTSADRAALDRKALLARVRSGPSLKAVRARSTGDLARAARSLKQLKARAKSDGAKFVGPMQPLSALAPRPASPVPARSPLPPKPTGFVAVRKYVQRYYMKDYRWPAAKLENKCGAPAAGGSGRKQRQRGGQKHGVVIDLTPSQKFAKEWFTPESPHKGLLGFWSVGTGKTSLGIGVASANFEPAGYTILWVTRSTLKEDLYKNMFTWVAHEGLRRELEAGRLRMPARREEQMKLLGKAWAIKPMSYKQFSNVLAGGNEAYQKLVRRNGAADPLRKTLVIIDEAHKLYSNEDLKGNEKIDTARLERMLRRSYQVSGADSAKVLLMTGTPYTTNPMDMVRLLNLLRPAEQALPVDFDEFKARFLDADGKFTAGGKMAYWDAISGTVSYLNREKDARQFSQPRFYKVDVGVGRSAVDWTAMLADQQRQLAEAQREQEQAKEAAKASCGRKPGVKAGQQAMDAFLACGRRKEEARARAKALTADVGELKKRVTKVKSGQKKDVGSQEAVLRTKCGVK